MRVEHQVEVVDGRYSIVLTLYAGGKMRVIASEAGARFWIDSFTEMSSRLLGPAMMRTYCAMVLAQWAHNREHRVYMGKPWRDAMEVTAEIAHAEVWDPEIEEV